MDFVYMEKKRNRPDNSRLFAVVFIMLLFLAEAVTFFFFFHSHATEQTSIFFGSNGKKSLTDNFMDFFNVVKYSADKDPYHCTYASLSEKAYPPLTYMLLYPFSKIFDYAAQVPGMARTTQLGLMSAVVPTMVLGSVMTMLLCDMQKGSRLIRYFTAAALLLSGVSLYAVERGNIVYLSAVCLIYFVMAYRSENPVERELSYMALAVAAALKVFPALFGVLLLADKQYKAAVRTAVYGLASGFLPFLFFKGGFSNIPQMVRNMQANSAAYMFSGTKRFGFVALGQWLGLPNDQSQQLLKIGLVCLAVSLLTFFRLRKDWKQVMLLTCGLLITPVNSGIYCGLYFFAPVILFLNDRRHAPVDWVYLALMVVALSPYQLTIHGQLISAAFPNLAVMSIDALLLIEAVISTARSLFRRKSPSAVRPAS